MSEILTPAILKRECIIYLGSKSIKLVSYMQLYNYLKNERRISLENSDEQYYDSNLIEATTQIANFDIHHYHHPPIFFFIGHTLSDEEIRQQKQSDNNHKIAILNTGYTVKAEVFDEYELIKKEFENEERLKKSEKDSKKSLRISNWSFLIAIAAFVISAAQLGVDYYDIHKGKDFKYEQTSMKLDSVQIKQNQQIINLLQTQKQKDTVIVNVVLPCNK